MYRGGGEIGGGDIKITDCATTQPDTASAATRLHPQTWGRRKSLLDEQAGLWQREEVSWMVISGSNGS